MKLVDFHRHFSKNALPLGPLKESLVALSFNIGGLLAGFIVASHFNVFRLSPWTIAVYPAILTGRGVIGGLFSGRLSTALHIGTVLPRLRGNTEEFYMLFKSVVVLTLETGLMIGLFSISLGSVFWGLAFADFFDVLAVVSATMFLGMASSLLTIALAFISFKKGLDTDVVVYPVMSTAADIIITLSYVFALNLFFLFSLAGRCAVVSMGLLLAALALGFLSRCFRSKIFVRTIRESIVTLVMVAFIVNITGTILRNVDKIVGSVRAIYTVYPALIDTVGDVGSVIGSTATTKLALGSLNPSFRSIRKHSTRIFTTWIASMTMFILYAIISLLTQGELNLNLLLSFSVLLLTTNIVSVAAVTLISFAVAILTFRRGLDPDNFVIPIESSLADSITTAALLVSLFLVNHGAL